MTPTVASFSWCVK